jgi:cytoskeleton protein RodZ
VEFGAAMRDMRKAHNRELSDVANALRIRQVYLQAIEDGRFDDLPGPTYAAGFVRAYADYLGLELDEVMRRYRSATGNISAQAALVPPSPMSEARLPTGFILLVAAILAAAAYGGWYYLTIHGQSPAEVVSALPKRISDAVGLGDKSTTKSVPPEVIKSSAMAPTAKPSAANSNQKAPIKPAESDPKLAIEPSQVVTVTPPTKSTQTSVSDAEKMIETAATEKPVAVIQPDPIAVPVVTAPTSNAVAVVEKMPTAESGQPQLVISAPLVTAKLPKTVTVEAPPEKIVAPAPEKVEVVQPLNPAASQVAAVPPQDNLESRIVLRATVTSWVELRDVGRKRLLSRLLGAGETYKVPGRPGILFTTGNAGGINILVDGQPIAALGPVGAVRRDIAMEPKTLLARKPGQR